MQTVGVISFHTSPLVQPGTGDGGGMNVYVRELVASLAQAGVACQVYTRRWDETLPDVVDVEPGFRVVHVDAGAPGAAKDALPAEAGTFTAGVIDHLATDPVDVIHAHYWLSGVAGHTIKHELDLPLVSTFHTLGRVKSQHGDPEPAARIAAEEQIVGCSDAVVANASAEADELETYYGADARRVEIVPPGVDHAFFSPGDQAGARAALGLDLGPGPSGPSRRRSDLSGEHRGPATIVSSRQAPHPMLLFVGRIQPLKGLDVAVRALADLDRDDAVLVAVGGTSGASGDQHLAEVTKLAADLGVLDRIVFVEAQPHHLLSTFYRAADVVYVPSRSESFGLVALEAAACGTPVVATAVGGLATLVDHGVSGFLVPDRDPAAFAAHTDEILRTPALAARLGAGGVNVASRYTWSATAGRLRRVYDDVASRSLLLCA